MIVIMKKTYIRPQTQELNLYPENLMLTMSVGGETNAVWTNKKEYSTLWETEDVEEETSGIW